MMEHLGSEEVKKTTTETRVQFLEGVAPPWRDGPTFKPSGFVREESQKRRRVFGS